MSILQILSIRPARTLMTGAVAVVTLAACQPDAPKNTADQSNAGQSSAAQTAPASSGVDVVRDFSLSNFTHIEQLGIDEVTVRQGANFAVQAKGRQQDLDLLDLRVENGKLIVSRKGPVNPHADDVDILVTMPKLTSIALRGAGDVDADILSGDAVSAVLAGAGEINIDRITAKSAALSISGAGDLDVESGTIDKGDYRLTGAGDLDADKLQAKQIAVTSSGVGSIKAHASDAAKVSLLGVGDVTIVGGAKCQTSKQGVGTVRC